MQPLPHATKLLHLRLVVLPPEPLVGHPVHTFGLLREWLHHVRAAADALPNRLRPAKGTSHLVLPLALVDKIVAMTAQEVAPRSVKDRNPPAASSSRTDKPWPLSSEVAGRPAQGHGLLHIFPFSAWTASVTVKQGNLIRQVANTHYAPDGAGLTV